MISLLNGDCLELMKDIEDKSIDLVVTDPPYLIDIKGGGVCAQGNLATELKTINTGFNTAILDELCRVMKKINCYFFCSQKQIPFYLNYFVKDKKCNWDLLAWHKTNPIPTCGNKYLSDTEYLLFFREKGV